MKELNGKIKRQSVKVQTVYEKGPIQEIERDKERERTQKREMNVKKKKWYNLRESVKESDRKRNGKKKE